MSLWPSIGKWGITSLRKGFYEFAFSSLEDVQRVRFVNAWSLSQGVLKLFPWSKDFTPETLKQTLAQVWIRIYAFDSASSKYAFERPFGHFVRVLVDLDMTKELSYKILVERIGFAFFVDIEYEKMPDFCHFCSCIGHSINNCKRKEAIKDQGMETDKRINKDKGKQATKHHSDVDKPSDTNIPNVPTPVVGTQEVKEPSCSQHNVTQLVENIHDGTNLENDNT
ncbi:uncharacterized protein LOC131639570 [Vicia villosa]|uniref:uncharacterized protein LOC131639570 n=1 Tax=Vicia villosa TaxID=3911 RepID=UPI00273C7D49|nr:uncharacterized protein LOC131639570 [Vicia villosa]